MATEAQMTANKANAQLSTGPTSEEGKAKSRLNAVQLGLYVSWPTIVGEDTAAWNVFRNAFHGVHGPKGTAQTHCIEQAAHAAYCLLRVPEMERKLAKDNDGQLVGAEPVENQMRQILRYQGQQRRHMLDFLAEFRRQKKDEAANGAGTPVRSPEPAAAAAPPPVQTSARDTANANSSAVAAPSRDEIDEEAERAQRRKVLEAKQAYLDEGDFTGLSFDEIGRKIDNHIKEIGLVVDSPQAKVN